MPCQSQIRPTGPWLAAVLAAGLALSACSPDRLQSTGSTKLFDTRERHPIVLTDSPEILDVFAVAHGSLDRRERGDVIAFGQEFRKSGQGGIRAHVPEGRYSHSALGEIRSLLGVQVAVTPYTSADPTLAQPIRLSFLRLQAKVASQCGTWPKDLGLSDYKASANNEPYWNLGCAVRSNMTAQTDDPIDLVRGRTESRPDTIRRMKVIEAIRNGQDPSTQYRKEATSVGAAVQN